MLLYTIDEAAEESFNIGRKDGQLTVDGTLDYEAESEHTVIVMATDASGAYDMITVTVEVLDEDDPPTISQSESESASECSGSKPVKCNYVENGEDPVATFDRV